eukprot:TRINITY_DN2290_c0_g1_i7.p1 TRINITY_DN2290_c0_g1~~TRINITY_DN2290_c0_g1_i7.p1  ORF type:complete len:451 (+),score=62.17 TRINITY_DN2290_c0_g1_i7:912-2264(+)
MPATCPVCVSRPALCHKMAWQTRAAAVATAYRMAQSNCRRAPQAPEEARGGSSLGDNAAEHDGNSVCEMVGAGGSSSSDDHTLGARASPVKRRKIFLSMKQKARSATTRAAGQSRVQRSERLGNGTPAGASEACSSAGGIRVGWSPVKGCTCGAILGALEPQFVVAKRKALEKKQSNARRNKNDVLLGYNYARLGLLVLTLLFDSRGSWLVHERCARELLGVSNSWMAGRHKLAVEAAQAPLVSMTKSAIAGSYDPDSMFKRIVRSTSCLLSVRQDFLVSPMTTRFELTAAVSHHGLHGKASNRRKTVQRDLFVAFVKKHRSPTGRTPDKCGRYHGAAYYLNSKWVILRPGRQKNGVVDSRRSFSEDFNAALVAAGWSRVHPDVPLRWLKELFGSTRRIEGTVSPSDEHITAYPHKTDACATCELLESDKRHSEQVLRAFPTMPSQRVKR